MMQSHEHEYRRLESIIDAANERIRELEDAFEDAENRIIELREVSDKLEKALAGLVDIAEHGDDTEDQHHWKNAVSVARESLAEVAALRKKENA